MGISERLLGKKNVNGKPRIDAVRPAAALPGGEVRIIGSGLRPPELRRPRVQFGELEGSVLISSDDFLVARVPEGAMTGPVVVSTTHDPATPYQAGVDLARELDAALITFDGTQHTVVFNGDACVDTAVVNFLVGLTPPPPGLRC